MTKARAAPDIVVTDLGTISTFDPLTTRGKITLSECALGDTTWLGDMLVVEHRFAAALAETLSAEGMVVR